MAHLKGVQSVKGEHKRAGASRGGACLTRHVSPFERRNSCSHRWQAWLDGKDHGSLYNGDAYKSLTDAGKRVGTSKKRSTGFPWWYAYSLPAPAKGDWDIGQGPNAAVNFTERCYRPYWHNSHHLIPNGVLREAIDAVGKGKERPAEVTLAVKQGLLEVKYNLNYKVNMLLLPMDRKVARALGLPRHLRTAAARSHQEYSANVLEELMQLFDPIQVAMKCESKDKPDYQALKEQLESYSGELHAMVEKAGKDGVEHLERIAPLAFRSSSR